jgi:hypothetical protein
MSNMIEVDINIIKYLIIFMVNNYSEKKKIAGKENKKKFKLNNEDDETDDDFGSKNLETISNLTPKDIVDYLNELYNNSISHVWNFLKESLEMLINSAFGKFLIKEKKIVNTYWYEPFNSKFKETDTYKNSVKDKLNLKNIYNIAKSLSHISRNNWVLLDENYISFSSNYKLNFIKRITNKDPNIDTWININSNLRKQRSDNFNYNQLIREIIEAFKNIVLILVFEELVSNGLINEFKPNLKITNKLLLPKDTGPIKQKRRELMEKMFNENKEAWLDSYYYLTNNKFRNLEKMRIDNSDNFNPKNKYKETNYFDYLKNEEWPLFYAMDWISQISFFHHYINHQILYVTGATGQGKSTQVPKLLLYALKVIDNKSNGRVVCTQPRIPPTINNSTKIAEELGLQIEQTTNNSTVKSKTSNYWVQFKHQKDSHTNDKILHSYLRIMTDGTLLEQLKSNPTMFKSIEKESKNKIKSKKFINENIYDILIVDESHEHGTNMDLILTLGKQACYFNNRIKLIIVSATMDDDEPIYRRYFSMINDDLAFPLKYPIEYPIVDKQLTPKAIYMDRRYHISPPGETTQYRVDEYYLENDIIEKDEKTNALKAQELGYKKIIEICNKSVKGEILFFANGQREILEAVKYLNSVLPSGNIALPYFADMHEIYKEIISKINNKISQIKNKRERIHEDWGVNFIEDPSIPNDIYKRAIIIATNVAEASVTIPGLTYVVDNGYSKVNLYDKEFSISNLEVEKISESSRLQRKGRVGRVGDGTVYYMYKKDARKNIKPKYKITQENLINTFLGLLSNKNIQDVTKKDIINYDRLIVSEDINPNMINKLVQNGDKNLSNHYTFKTELIKIYNNNYTLFSWPRENPESYINYEKAFYYRYQFKTMEKTFYVLDSGQLIYNLFDLYGEFFLIHPFEEKIKRNILNEIIEYDKKKINIINIEDYDYIISYLFNLGLIVDYNANSLYYNTYEKLYVDRNWVKTELGQKISEITSKFENTIPEALTFIAASAMGCLTEILEINLLLNKLQYDLTKLLPDTDKLSLNQKNKNWNNFYSIYKKPNYNSDIIFLYEIIQKIKKYFSDSFIFTTQKSKTKVILDQHFKDQLNKFKKLSDKYNEIPSNFDGDLWNKLSTLKNNGNLQSKYEDILKTDKSSINLIYKDNDQIIKWANLNNLNSNLIINFIKELGKLYLNKIFYDKNEFFIWANDLNINFMKHLTIGTIEERIIRSFIYGRPFHFTYTLTRSGPPCTFMNLQVTPVKFSESLIELSNELVFFINYTKKNDVTEYTTTILSKIDIDWLIPAIPLFINPRLVPNIIKIKDLDFIYPNSDYIQIIIRQMINKWNKNKIIWYSENLPIMKYFYNNINKIISNR